MNATARAGAASTSARAMAGESAAGTMVRYLATTNDMCRQDGMERWAGDDERGEMGSGSIRWAGKLRATGERADRAGGRIR